MKKRNIESEWLVWKNGFDYIQLSCDNCGHRLTADEDIPDYCPSCGAHMGTASISIMNFIDLITRGRAKS